MKIDSCLANFTNCNLNCCRNLKNLGIHAGGYFSCREIIRSGPFKPFSIHSSINSSSFQSLPGQRLQPSQQVRPVRQCNRGHRLYGTRRFFGGFFPGGFHIDLSVKRQPEVGCPLAAHLFRLNRALCSFRRSIRSPFASALTCNSCTEISPLSYSSYKH